MSFIIYIIENAVSPAVYIGKTVQRLYLRWGVHRAQLRSGKHRNPHMQAAWNKYGESAFTCRALQICENEKELNRAEIAAIALYRASGAEVYNACDGGEGASGRKQSASEREMRSQAARKALSTPEAKQRKSEAMLKRWSEPGEREKQSERMRGSLTDDGRRRKIEAQSKYWSDSEHRQQRIDAIKEAYQRPELIELKREQTAQRYSDPAYREMMAAQAKLRVRDKESRQKTSDANARRYGYTYTLRSPEGVEFVTNNLHQFCKDHGLHSSTMRRVCAGELRAHKKWTGQRTKEEAPSLPLSALSKLK